MLDQKTEQGELSQAGQAQPTTPAPAASAAGTDQPTTGTIPVVQEQAHANLMRVLDDCYITNPNIQGR